MKLLLAIMTVMIMECGPTPTPDPVHPPSPATCLEVCDNGARLGCEWSKPTAQGESCMTVCETVQSSGIVQWDLDCRAGASSCEAVDACED